MDAREIVMHEVDRDRIGRYGCHRGRSLPGQNPGTMPNLSLLDRVLTAVAAVLAAAALVGLIRFGLERTAASQTVNTSHPHGPQR